MIRYHSGGILHCSFLQHSFTSLSCTKAKLYFSVLFCSNWLKQPVTQDFRDVLLTIRQGRENGPSSHCGAPQCFVKKHSGERMLCLCGSTVNAQLEGFFLYWDRCVKVVNDAKQADGFYKQPLFCCFRIVLSWTLSFNTWTITARRVWD